MLDTGPMGVDPGDEIADPIMDTIMCPACWENDPTGMEHMLKSLNIVGQDYETVRNHVMSKGA